MRPRPLVLALLLGLGGLLSAATPAQNLPNLTYATVDGTPLRLDLYRPPNPTAPTPVVLWIHGGGWCAGARRSPVTPPRWCKPASPSPPCSTG